MYLSPLVYHALYPGSTCQGCLSGVTQPTPTNTRYCDCLLTCDTDLFEGLLWGLLVGAGLAGCCYVWDAATCGIMSLRVECRYEWGVLCREPYS